eukprot:6514509-Ditylum_brightwellii.AAC.1
MASTQTYFKSIKHNRPRLGRTAPNRRDVESLEYSLDSQARKRPSEWGEPAMGGATEQHGRRVSYRSKKLY